MAKVTFDYNLQKDAWSWVSIAKDKDMWGLNWRDQIAHIPDDLLEKIESASFSRAQKIVENYIKNDERGEYKNKMIGHEMKALEKAWEDVEEKYFNILSKMILKSIFSSKFKCYFTKGFVCEYNEKENWFMVSMWHSIPASITTICHEIMHLQFLYYYRSYLEKKGLKNNQIEDLKESLTFLLNEPEFFKIVLCYDEGYPKHKDLREKLKSIWSKNKDFQKLIDDGISLIKNRHLWIKD